MEIHTKVLKGPLSYSQEKTVICIVLATCLFFFFFLFLCVCVYVCVCVDPEKHQCVVASCILPTGDLACNAGMCPDWESNQQPFSLQAGTKSTEPHHPGPFLAFFFFMRPPCKESGGGEHHRCASKNPGGR